MSENNLSIEHNRNNKIALRLENISKIYPGTIALQNINFDIMKGNIHGIIGKNGAGKSTLIGIIAGIISPTKGKIIVNDNKYSSLSRIKAKNENISVITQEAEIVPDFTIAENLFLPNYIRRGKFIDWPKLYFEASKIMKKAGFDSVDVKQKTGDLPISEQQILLVLKACYIENSEIIIMDEVSSSLSLDDQNKLYKIIAERKKEGKTIIFISHRMDEMLSVCDEISVIRDGKLVCTQDCSKLTKHDLSSLIVGKSFTSQNFDQNDGNSLDSSKNNSIVFSALKLSKSLSYKNISFDLKKGEILGIAGLRGSGRTEILKGIAGIEPADSGYIRIGNLKQRFKKPSQAFKNRIVYLTEDRDNDGLVGNLTIRENLTISILKKISNLIAISKNKEKKVVSELINLLEIKAFSYEQQINQLSGGNRQKVVVGKVIAVGPKVYLLDEPTKGIDIEAKTKILKLIKCELSKSSSIVMTSPGLEELFLICDRIIILQQGEITGEFSREEYNEKQIYLAMQ